MHYICVCAILVAVAKKTSWTRTGQRAHGGLLRSNATQKDLSCARGPARRPLAPVLGGEPEARPKLAHLMLRSVPAKGGMPDGSLRAALANTPFCYESHAHVRAPADGGTSTRSHGAAPAQECRLRLKRPPPKAAPWFPPFKSSTPENLSGLLRLRLFCAVANGNAQVSVLERKIALGAYFPPKRNPKDSWREGED